MRIKSAWKLLESGKRIRRDAWPPGLHIAMSRTGYVLCDATGTPIFRSVSGPDRRADDWTEYDA